MASRQAYLFLLVSLLFSSSAFAGPITIQQMSAFIFADELGGQALEYTDIGYQYDEVSTSGIDTSFSNNLDSDNYGSVSWGFQNSTGSQLSNAWMFVFLDAEIDQSINTFFNEFGELVSVDGVGSGDSFADAWEIDEPGYIFGDIYDNLLSGYLDNTNNVPSSFEDDVSLALGFDLGNIMSGDQWEGVFEISLANIGGLMHSDLDSGVNFYFNGEVNVMKGDEHEEPVPVPEPNIALCLVAAFMSLKLLRKV